ncbi:hypothetical protein ACSQ67_008658 [Phaseolus vulgaris]
MRALGNLGLDAQQAVISCFNGFVLDVFRAESFLLLSYVLLLISSLFLFQQYREGQDVLPEQIKAVLLETAGSHSMM